MENPKTLEQLKKEGPDGIFSCAAEKKKERPNIKPTDTFIFTTTTTTTTPAPTQGTFSKFAFSLKNEKKSNECVK